MNHCHYHPGAKLLERLEAIPTFATVELLETHRTVLHCSVAGCPFVAILYEKDRVNMRYCNVCGVRITGTECLTDFRCPPCRNSKQHVRDRKARLGLKWRGNPGMRARRP